MNHHNAAAINALPQSYSERITFITFVERFGAPHQLLTREANQSTMSCKRRQGVGETEAVGQEHVCSLSTELLTVEILTKHKVAQHRLGRTDNRLVGIPRTTSYVPTALNYILFQFLVFQWVIFLHPSVLHCSFEVEYIIRILSEQRQVLVKGVSYVVSDSSLNIPIPLGIQVGIGHHIRLLFLCHNIHRHQTRNSNCCYLLYHKY